MDRDQTTVFVIDDDEALLRAMERLMRSAGWHAECYRTAQEFLSRLPYDGVGCVLLDVQMAGMTGPQLQQQMIERAISLPIIYLTGRADVPMSIAAMKNGAMDILLKPVEDEVVLNAITAAIARHETTWAEDRARTEISKRVLRLSDRERQVLEQVIGGRLNKQIAGDLGITEKTVKAHRAHVMEKLATRSVAEVVRMCAAVGIAPRDAALRARTAAISGFSSTQQRRITISQIPSHFAVRPLLHETKV